MTLLQEASTGSHSQAFISMFHNMLLLSVSNKKSSWVGHPKYLHTVDLHTVGCSTVLLPVNTVQTPSDQTGFLKCFRK